MQFHLDFRYDKPFSAEQPNQNDDKPLEDATGDSHTTFNMDPPVPDENENACSETTSADAIASNGVNSSFEVEFDKKSVINVDAADNASPPKSLAEELNEIGSFNEESVVASETSEVNTYKVNDGSSKQGCSNKLGTMSTCMFQTCSQTSFLAVWTRP